MLKEWIHGENIGIALFFIGLYGLCARRNIIKSILSLSIIQGGLILFFVSMTGKNKVYPPIHSLDPVLTADPLPQALMVTAIVVGISVTALSLTVFVSLYHKYGSTNWKRVKRKSGEGNE